MNRYSNLINPLSKEYKRNKKGNFQDLIENSLSVASATEISNQFILDLIAVYNFGIYLKAKKIY
jgi:hypothetical protein